MPKAVPLRAPPSNRLLTALPKKERNRLLLNFKPFTLVFGEVIYEPGDPIRHIYFPTGGIISLLAAVENREALEVGIVGREGMVGLPVFMGVKTSPNLTIVQGSGSALRIRATIFQKECDDSAALQGLMRRFAHSQLLQISQGAACNRFHPTNARLARWLLTTRDRMEMDTFQLTQEFLSNMLGVRREGVNRAAGTLQKEHLISYSRGSLTILNRKILESISCQCYRIIKDEYDSFLPK